MEEAIPQKRCPQRVKQPHRSDFCFGRTLGEGSYARYYIN
jgi:hypothetical protein